jgi:hypothetical protein
VLGFTASFKNKKTTTVDLTKKKKMLSGSTNKCRHRSWRRHCRHRDTPDDDNADIGAGDDLVFSDTHGTTASKRVLTVSSNNSAVWNVETGELVFALRGSHTLPKLSQDGTKFYYLKERGVVIVHDIDTNTQQTIPFRSESNGLFLDPSNSLLLVISFVRGSFSHSIPYGDVMVYDARTGFFQNSQGFEVGSRDSIKFSPNGAYVMYESTSGNDGGRSTQVRPIVSNNGVRQIQDVIYTVDSFNRSGRSLVLQSGAISNTHALVQLYEVGIKTVFRLIDHATQESRELTESELVAGGRHNGSQLFSPDGSVALTYASDNNSLSVRSNAHQAESGTLRRTFSKGRVYAYNEDNTLAAVSESTSITAFSAQPLPPATFNIVRLDDGGVVSGPFVLGPNARDVHDTVYFCGNALVTITNRGQTVTVYDVSSGEVRYEFP